MILSIFLAGMALAMAQSWEAPEEARAVPNPLEPSPAVVAEGEALFQKQCTMCHGDGLKGDGSAVQVFGVQPPDLSTVEARERLTDGEIFYKITVGKNPMPSMKSRLSEEERWKVVVFVRSLQAK